MRVGHSLLAAGPILAAAFTALAFGCDPSPRPEPSTSPSITQVELVPGDAADWSGEGCTRPGCHAAIEPIRAYDSGMMVAIQARGREVGEPDGCTVCHGGSPDGPGAVEAHAGATAALAALGGPDAFYADPASPWINDRTCGTCHEELVAAQHNSLMMTEAGKIQGTTWSFGTPANEGYDHLWANYAVQNPEDPAARLGTDAYREYMEQKSAAHPNVFVEAHEPVPNAPEGHALDDPRDAAFTYIRAECQRCHLGVKGRARRGDYRGMGCGACHMPYGNEGRYEGADTTLGPNATGRPLVHRLQGTREATVSVHDVDYAGIPVETCTTCHNRGKRIGVSYQGLMESAWASPYTEGGGGQPGLHSKHYLAMEQDVHYRAGMLCQDCHTSGDVHGDRFLSGTNLGMVEIECSDCHGTPQAYPWELPLGWGDENGPGEAEGDGRGVLQTVPSHLEDGTVHPPRDGYLVTARGNPMPDVVRDGNDVVVHTAGGKDLRFAPLKQSLDRGTLSTEAVVAMVNTPKHVGTMECYSCHASWAPQCYGCHVKVDYSEGKRAFDWVAAGQKHLDPEHAADPDESSYETWLAGEVTEMRSYLRWEDPALGLNGEGRVSPIVPGCQVSVTVIGEDGETLAQNEMFRTPAHTEGAGEQGQVGSDMSPLQPHTIGKARSCESCHGSAKAMGFGFGGTRTTPDGLVVDLQTADGEVLPHSAVEQRAAVNGLEAAWSAVLDAEGRQVQTVGSHFLGSGPLTPAQREGMDRRNLCVDCHQEIPTTSLAVSVLHHVADAAGQLPVSRDDHGTLIRRSLLTSAWLEVLLPVFAGFGLVGFVLWRRRRSN
ncbi:MAG: cytochrome C [Myxococcota bacterium]